MFIVTYYVTHMTSARVWSPLFGSYLRSFNQILVDSETLLTVSLSLDCAPKACLSSSNMGARATKLGKTKTNKETNLVTRGRGSSKSRGNEDQILVKKVFSMNFEGKEEAKMKKKSLQELHMKPPPAFRKFESEVDWQNMDQDIALQLWEDVFKPLYTFYEVRRISNE